MPANDPKEAERHLFREPASFFWSRAGGTDANIQPE